ncbi:hypothetical protein GE09DRAFT_1053330 [Coniochaeta sp. 2T2.1]|nr:hypothetical protein GE09DRAFT_1053330 [Coniochaeta sp. 2T2.1]
MRLGPLTSQGLGRSPYDDVVQGDGEADPREPSQQYDERGRPVNPVTRQMNRDIIRSHNEVMQVIGVAEPEDVASEPQKRVARHLEWENAMGLRLLAAGRFVYATGAWGVNGMRQRILLYKSYSHIPLLGLWSHERRQRSITAMVLAGYPAFATIIYNRLRPSHFEKWIVDHPYGRPVYQLLKSWVRLHLNVFGVLQQLDILPVYQLLPDLKFFIPFTSSSPIPAPPPPISFTTGEIARWLGNLALNAAPLLAMYVSTRIAADLRAEIWQYIRSRLPTPTQYQNSRSYSAAIREARARLREERSGSRPDGAAQFTTPTLPPNSPAEPTSQTQPTPASEPELNAGGFPTTSQMRPRDEPQAEAGSAPHEDQPVPAVPSSPRHARRRSTLTNAGPGQGRASEPLDTFYPSDDEDNSGDMVSTTLISFDVEATDATDPPPGQWAAELRPNVAEGGNRSDGGTAHGRHSRQPKYKSTTLTRLPSGLAADMLAWVPSRIFWASVDAVIWRWFVRSFLAARGLGADHVHPVLYWGVTRQMLANFVGMELLHFFIQFDIWAVMYVVADYFLLTEDEWGYIDGTLASPSDTQ